MSQTVEAPGEDDLETLAHQFAHADELVADLTGQRLSGRLSDLALLQRVLDTGQVQPEATYTLQALGIAFGRVLVGHTPHHDWWMVEDEHGRDPAVRYKETSLLVFPQTMISKRVEDGEAIDVQDFYEDLQHQLASIRAEHYPDEAC